MDNQFESKAPVLQPGEVVWFGCDLASAPDESALVCWVVRDGYIMIVNVG